MGGHSSSSQTSTPTTTYTPGSFGTTDYGKSSQLSSQLESLINTPMSFGPQNSDEQNFLSSIMDQTGGRAAVRGLGAPTGSALASDIAPAMLGFQQQAETARMGTMQGLAELIGLAMPQVVGGTKTTGSSGGWKIG